MQSKVLAGCCSGKGVCTCLAFPDLTGMTNNYLHREDLPYWVLSLILPIDESRGGRARVSLTLTIVPHVGNTHVVAGASTRAVIVLLLCHAR